MIEGSNIISASDIIKKLIKSKFSKKSNPTDSGMTAGIKYLVKGLREEFSESIQENSLRTKLNRDTFNSRFFLRCICVLGANFNIIEENDDTLNMYGTDESSSFKSSTIRVPDYFNDNKIIHIDKYLLEKGKDSLSFFSCNETFLGKYQKKDVVVFDTSLFESKYLPTKDYIFVFNNSVSINNIEVKEGKHYVDSKEIPKSFLNQIVVGEVLLVMRGVKITELD